MSLCCSTNFLLNKYRQIPRNLTHLNRIPIAKRTSLAAGPVIVRLIGSLAKIPERSDFAVPFVPLFSFNISCRSAKVFGNLKLTSAQPVSQRTIGS